LNVEQNPQRLFGLVLLLGAAGALWYWSTTQSGSDAISEGVDDVGDLVNTVPRGIRNNNPGNIVRNSIVWNGALTQPQVEALGQTWDAKFVQFDTPVSGLRALAMILITYAARGANTVDSIISTYAPSSENNTAAYIAAVSSSIGAQPGQTINVTANLGNIMAAIVQHENGEQPYASSTIVQAISAASQG
jgi:hypothetical protein